MSDALTDHGILTDYPDVTPSDMRGLHGPPVYVGPDCVVYADQHGYELNEWADALDVSRDELSERMHDLANEVCEYDWSTVDPVAIDADSFGMDGWIADYAQEGLSAAEAVDYYMTEQNRLSQSTWARHRGINQQAVSKNVAQARDKLRRNLRD